MILIKVDVTLQTKYLTLKPLLKEQSMLDGNSHLTGCSLIWGYHGSQKKRIGSEQGYTHVHTEKERERWRSWRYRGQARQQFKKCFPRGTSVSKAQCCFGVFFVFVFCSVIFMDAGIC